MDINSLLSPSETPRSASSTPNSPQQSPFKFVQRTQSGPGPLRHSGHGASPLSQSVMNQSSIPAHVLSPAPQQGSSPLISPVPATTNSQLARTISNHSIDTLSDLASLSGQGLKSAPAQFRQREGLVDSSTTFTPAMVVSLTSNPRASFDINMMEAPKQTARTDFSRTSLPTDRQEELSRLTEYIQENPSAYESHISVIKILHQGFIDHIYPPNQSNTRRDPHTYDLLPDLRSARDRMEKLFAVGESLWVDWLQDESILAQTAEERIAVVENFRKAVEEEVGSVSLWTAYGDWVRHCYTWAHDKSQDHEADEERIIGQELFTWQLVIDTWQEAVEQTSLDLATSHVVWNKSLAIRVPNLQQKLQSDQVATVMALFEQRLQTAHADWDNTFQEFSSFVSVNFDSEKYESIMSEMLRSATNAKKQWSVRESFEAAIEQAVRDQDQSAEYEAFARYIEWEQTPEKRKKLNPELTNALFQRAELRFPSYTTLWEEHTSFLLDQSKPVLLPVLERATKHCPWSGSLWSQYLLSSDRAGQAFDETEGIKHKATSTGLLEAAGIEEVTKVHAAWCSYLRRRSFRPDASEEDLDVAEMGIRSSIENVASLAAKLGLGDISDPAFRLHRIYITFLSESGRWDNARQEFDNSVRDYGKSWEFWMLFYHWEMGRWRRFASNQQNNADESLGNVAPPHLATAVLKKALGQPDLDYPEPIMQALITHCEDFEDAEELQLAMVKVKKLEKAVTARRQIEAAMAAEVANSHSADRSEDTTASQGAKRKREEETDESSNKKLKNEEVAQQSVEQMSSSNPKRDRENATILVENLPENITDTEIRQYFTSCGLIRSLKVLHENESVSAIIEFDDDDAAKYALSRDEQELDGAVLSVTMDSGSTLYLTNYKPAADETYIRSILDKYGEIISVRFPSLQGNKKRRFCYVQFKLPTEAQTASAELDEHKIDDYTLTCKISNPTRRQVRKENNVNDGHTIFIGQLNFKATEPELEQTFSRFGTIEKIRMPLHPSIKNRNKGIAYITFSTIDEAQTAASETNGSGFMERKITVEVADSKNGGSRRRESSARSVTPMQNGENGLSAREDPATRRARQVFLANVPDTVNEARLREIGGNHGTVARVILKTDHQGAILEFSSMAEAGQASLKLEGHEITSGRQLHVVSETEMLSGNPEKKADGFAKEKVARVSAAPIGNTAPIRRPQQPGARKKGNLGQRNAAARSNDSTPNDQTNIAVKEGKKNNNDFRAMLRKN